MTTDAEQRIIPLTVERLDEAGEVLARSFMDYPLTRYIFVERGELYAKHLQVSFRLDCLWKLELGWPFLGAFSGERLVGVALVVGSEPAPPDHPLYEQEQALNNSFGVQTASRIEGYYDMKIRHRLPQPHLYLEAIGVLPEYRGQGHAGRLLKAVHRLSQADPRSQGVALDTQLQGNLALYQHFGYRVIGDEMFGEVHTWFMHRPDLLKTGETSGV